MKNNKVTVSAPGKLLLMGDHAVVYGYPCIVTAISERLYVTEGEVIGDSRFIDAAIAAWGTKETKLSAQRTFSGNYGFGSSSAVTVAALKFLRPNATLREIFEMAYKIVMDVQGVGSGFDVAAATIGGTLFYGDGGKILEQLPIKDMPLLVGYTGIKADTVSLVHSVAQKREKEKIKVDRIFEAIGKLVEEAKTKMIEGDWERVGRLMDFNQEYLRDLGVSSEKLESLISAAKNAGAWGAKLSGAGGGDCMIAVAPDDKKEAISKAMSNAGGIVVNVTFGAEGVRLEP
jgi:mevalonate kinase